MSAKRPGLAAWITVLFTSDLRVLKDDYRLPYRLYEYLLISGSALSIHCGKLPVEMERLFEDVTVEEEQCLQRDILRGSRHLSLHRQMGRKDADF